jgi:IS66 Orf2 like protein
VARHRPPPAWEGPRGGSAPGILLAGALAPADPIRQIQGGDLIKIVWHDGIGMSLYAKRLERGRFIWPSPADGVVAISAAQLLAHIFKREGELVPHLVPHHPADADPARLGEGF